MKRINANFIIVVVLLACCVFFLAEANAEFTIYSLKFERTETDYNINSKLSDFIDKEGLQIELDYEKAVRKYGLIDKKEVAYNPSFQIPHFYMFGPAWINGYIKELGITRGIFSKSNNVLVEIEKCISIEKGNLSYEAKREIYKSFIQKYGKPHVKKGDNSDPANNQWLNYFLKHHNDFIDFKFSAEEKPAYAPNSPVHVDQAVILLSISSENELLKLKNSDRNKADRLKKSF